MLNHIGLKYHRQRANRLKFSCCTPYFMSCSCSIMSWCVQKNQLFHVVRFIVTNSNKTCTSCTHTHTNTIPEEKKYQASMYTREIKLYVEIAGFYPDSSSSNQRGYYRRRLRRRPSFDAHYLLCDHFPVLFCISMPVFTLAYAKPWVSFKRTLPTSAHHYHSFYRQYRQDIHYSNENEIARNIHLCQESSCPTKHIYFIIFRHNVLGNMQSGYNGTHGIPHFYPSNNLLYYSNL